MKFALESLKFPITVKSTGRQRSKATEILERFRCKRSNRYPKKEIVRCEVIRGIKRAIRQLSEEKTPTKGWHGFSADNKSACELWEALKRFGKKNWPMLTDVANTESGPKTDGKAGKVRTGTESRFNSFNDAFCRWFYKDPAVKCFHRLYISLIFQEESVAQLTEKLPFVCCKGVHGDRCSRKWESLKRYLMDDMVNELSVGRILPRPFLPTILIAEKGIDLVHSHGNEERLQ